jgi:purine-binding chemotaxis protein CheW
MNQETEPGQAENSMTNDTDVTKYIVFSLSGEEYGIPLLKVKEVVAIPDITPVPYGPTHFKGIMNLRGQVFSVIDLRLKLKLAKAEINPESAIIILDLNPIHFGIIVDTVESVRSVSSLEVQPPPEMESQIKSDYMTGIVKQDKKLVILLDVEKTLNGEDLRTIRRNAKAA